MSLLYGLNLGGVVNAEVSLPVFSRWHDASSAIRLRTVIALLLRSVAAFHGRGVEL